MDIHRLRTNLAHIADDVDKTAIELRHAGNAQEIQKVVNDLIWLASSLVKLEESWRENN